MSNLGCSSMSCVVIDNKSDSLTTFPLCQCLRSLPDENRVHVEAKLHQLRKAEEFIKYLSSMDHAGLKIIMENYWDNRMPKL